MTDTKMAPTDADIIALADETRTGEPGRDGYILPISFARAVLAKWGGSEAQAAAPIKTLEEAIAHAEDKAKGNSACAMEHAKLAAWLTDLQLLRANLAAREVAQAAPVWMPNRRRIIYTASQVQAMLTAAPRNAPLYDPDDVAFSARCCAGGTDAPTELTSIAAAEVAAPIAPAREPLTDEQIDEIHLANSDAYERGDVEYESHGFARAIEHHHGITAAQKGGQHGTE